MLCVQCMQLMSHAIMCHISTEKAFNWNKNAHNCVLNKFDVHVGIKCCGRSMLWLSSACYSTLSNISARSHWLLAFFFWSSVIIAGFHWQRTVIVVHNLTREARLWASIQCRVIRRAIAISTTISAIRIVEHGSLGIAAVNRPLHIWLISTHSIIRRQPRHMWSI